MTEDVEDEKYAKVAKQTQRNSQFLILLSVGILLTLFGFLGLPPSSSGQQTSLRQTNDANSDSNNGNPPPTTTNVISTRTIQELEQDVVEWDTKVRAIKERVDIFETDEEGQAAAQKLQEATRQLLHRRYGIHEPYRVVMTLEFQDTIPDFNIHGKDGSFTIELAPSSLQPHSIYTFLELCRHWKGGAFHRIASHVLQAMVHTRDIRHLAFQEYSPAYPHRQGTVGYAGRPSGPEFYVSIKDNTRNHGPGSQQKHNPYEADSCFGTVVEGFDDKNVLRISKVPGTGFLGDARKHVRIPHVEIQIPNPEKLSEYIPWKEIETTD